MTRFILPYQPIRYDNPADAFRPYDPRFPEIAAALSARMRETLSTDVIEHVGSTAIPGCAGKGVIDLMLVYEAGEFERVLPAAEAMGFRVFRSREPFPEERPVLVGTFAFDGEAFRVHFHLIPADDEEVGVQRRFRDRLRANSSLVEAYVAAKQASLAASPTDSTDYNAGKEAFIRGVVREPSSVGR